MEDIIRQFEARNAEIKRLTHECRNVERERAGMQARIDAKSKNADQAERSAEAASREAANASGLLKASQKSLRHAQKMLCEIDDELAGLRREKEKYIKLISAAKIQFRDEMLSLATTVVAHIDNILSCGRNASIQDAGQG